MRFIADLHIHSHFSIATSRELRPEFLYYWARLKGIKVVGTGDFTHPGWTAELKEKLEPAGDGLFRVKQEFKKPVPFKTDDDVRFMLTSEISNIYKKNGKVRKVHNVVMAPSFEMAEKIQAKLAGMGFNITSDGRPILGLDSRDLLEICLEASEDIFFVPAHIWTPWFSALGSKSGFDSIQECYGDLAHHIFAVETGLSTDPAMNWLVSSLDNFTLLSNSDAHSPEKLGRNANILDTELSYPAIINAMKTGDNFLGTIDFFPEEGKYHYDGHRKCNICWNPLETLEHDEMCPVCDKKVTEGVLNRVAQLADRDDIETRANRRPFYSLIPLKELLAELEGVGPSSKKIAKQYELLVHKAGSEFNLLLNYDIEKVKQMAGNLLGEAIQRMRNREVYIKEGFDGEFGKIKVFGENEKPREKMQEALFLNEPEPEYQTIKKPRPLISFDIKKFQTLKKEKGFGVTGKPLQENFDLFSAIPDITDGLNPEQKEAVNHSKGAAMVIAGPGTGKTKVLTTRFANLIKNDNVSPESILAVTFTNKAAEEMNLRVKELLKDEKATDKVRISTFHSFGLSVLDKYYEKADRHSGFMIIDSDEKNEILKEIGIKKAKTGKISVLISEIKQHPGKERDDELAGLFEKYETYLKKINAFDFDDLIRWPVLLLQSDRYILQECKDRFKWLLVDEYQDVNLLQYQLIRLLMPDNDSNIFVIGDPNQAIYGFRGADVKFIGRFKTDYPDARFYNLKKSYRCSGSILQASGNIIDGNEGFLEGVKQGVKIKIAENTTDKSEAEYIARTVEQMIGGVGFFSMDSSITAGHKEKEIDSLSDFAVLCRTGKQMSVLEKAFKDHRIPYQKIGDEPFYKEEPVKSVIDVLKVVHVNDSSFKGLTAKGKRLEKIETESMVKEFENFSVSRKIDLVIDRYFGKEKKEYSLSFNAIKELAGKYGDDTGRFLTELSLGSPVDVWKTGIEAVNLMTLHASKGLEFNCVFIAGCEDGLIPYSLFEDKKSDIEEEKRLLYVGMTRAKSHLFLTYAKKRFIMGKSLDRGRSPFIDSIEKELIEQQKQQYKRKVKKDNGQLDLF